MGSHPLHIHNLCTVSTVQCAVYWFLGRVLNILLSYSGRLKYVFNVNYAYQPVQIQVCSQIIAALSLPLAIRGGGLFLVATQLAVGEHRSTVEAPYLGTSAIEGSLDPR